MPCSEWENLLSEYLDGELPPDQAGRVRQHLLECESCARFFRGIKADAEEISAAFDLPRLCPVGFAERTMRLMERPARRRGRAPYVLAVAAASIVAAFLVLRPTSIGSVTRIMNRTGLAVSGGVSLLEKGIVRDVGAGSAISRGNTIRTAADRVVFVRLKTGDEVIINRESSVTFAGRDSKHGNVVDVNNGEAFVRAATGEGSFAVRTQACNAEVVGTQFSVTFDAEAACTTLTVVEGMVRFHNLRGDKLVIGGHQCVASADAPPPAPKAVDARALTAWIDPPSSARIQQVARELTADLRARVVPSRDVFEIGEPIIVTAELTNLGREAVQLSRSLFVDREDTAPQRSRYKLSQIMLSKASVYGAELAGQSAQVPAPELVELKPGATWRVSLNLAEPAEYPALRSIRGPGAYSIAVAFAVAASLPGAPDDSMVWADVASESVIVHVISMARPREGEAVAGLQLGLTSKAPGCRLGESLAIQFSLKGVTSDQIAVSTAGTFQAKIEPITFGILSDHAMDIELPAKLEKTLAELGVDGGQFTLPEVFETLSQACGINVLADSAVLKGEAVSLDGGETLAESLLRLCEKAGATFEVGRSAIWFLAAAEADTVDAAGSLAKLESDKGWITLEAVDSKGGELKLATGGMHLPRPGLYRCTVQYSNMQTKDGSDWAGAWLGSVISRPIVVAVIEPPSPDRRDDNGLSLRIRQTTSEPPDVPRRQRAGEASQSVRLELEFRNTSDKTITLRPGDGLTIRGERLFRDILNPDCYEETDPVVTEMLEKRVSFRLDEAAAGEILSLPVFADLGGLAGTEALGERKVRARARDISAGEVLEFIARAGGVSFMCSGEHTHIKKSDSRGFEGHTDLPVGALGADAAAAITIPPGASRALTVTTSLREPGRHRLQVQYLRTGRGGDEEDLWTGDARSNPLVVEVRQ